MNWQSIISALIAQLTPVFETWFVAWLESVLPTVSSSLPAPLGFAATPSDVNKLLLLHEARATTNVWNVLKRSEIDTAITFIKTGSING